jgi:hypothetical protein
VSESLLLLLLYGSTVLERTLVASPKGGIFNLFRPLRTSNQTVAKACTYTGQHDTEDADKHLCLKRDSNPRAQGPRDQSLRLRPRDHWDRHIRIARPKKLMHLTDFFLRACQLQDRKSRSSDLNSCSVFGRSRVRITAPDQLLTVPPDKYWDSALT